MSFLNPLASPWLLLVPALLALYMLRARPQRMPVSSLRLWQALPRIDRTKARLRRPPRSLLLLLQLLVVGLGALSLMRPAMTAPASRHLVIVLDASGSMQASDGSGTRFAGAAAEAGRIVDSMGQEDRATILRAGTGVTALCQACRRAEAARAVGDARPGAGRADIAGALGTAAGLARHSAGSGVETVLVSDGAYDPLPADSLPPALRFVQVGGQQANVGITRLSARRPPDGSPGYAAFSRVDNAGDKDVSVDVAVLADTVPLPSRSLNIPARGHADLVWQVPAGTARFTVRLQRPDGLAADNQAVLFLPTTGQRKVAVLSSTPDLYIRALSGIPGLDPAALGNDASAGTDPDTSSAGAAFTVIQGRLPDPLPAGNLLVVDPQGALVASDGSIENVRTLATAPNQPLLYGVDLGALLVQKAQKISEPPPWLEPVVWAEGGPLLLAGEQNGRRVVVLTFDPADSNLPKLAAFPLLMSNVAEWLYPLAGTQALKPGQPLYLAPGSRVTLPDGASAAADSEGRFTATEEAGAYKVVSGPNAGLTFAVNMSDPNESDLAAHPHPEARREPPPAAADAVAAGNEYWPPLAALALVFLGGEWLLYCLKRGQA